MKKTACNKDVIGYVLNTIRSQVTRYRSLKRSLALQVAEEVRDAFTIAFTPKCAAVACPCAGVLVLVERVHCMKRRWTLRAQRDSA